MATFYVPTPCIICGQPLCDGCGRCHRCRHTRICTPKGVEEKLLMVAKSQKIRGLVALHQGPYAFSARTLNILAIFNKDSVIDEGNTTPPAGSLWPLFARPCPVRPRHGFVESRVVKSWAEVKTVLEETLKVEPEGEVMLTPLIDAAYNAIWTPTLLTIGKGHDGATAGKDTVTIPIMYIDGEHKNEYEGVFKKAGINPDTEAPYLEVVYQNQSKDFGYVITQLRAGTPLAPNCTPDFLPETVEVEEVIKTNGEDLVEWEAITIKLEGKKGVVVWHPGGSMADHYSVHARSRNIPIITTFEPQVGETLVPTENPDEEDPLPSIHYVRIVNETKPDPRSVLDGVLAGEAVVLNTHNAGAGVYALLMALHFSSVMGGDNGKWLGMAAALMIRLGSVALVGEARHWPQSNQHGFTREEAWKRAWGRSLTFHRANLSRLAQVFRYGRWHSPSFGGKNWALCAYSLAPIFTAIGHLARDLSDEAVGELVRAINVSVNQAHNSGWWLNKFSDSAAMDEIQAGDISYILRAVPTLIQVEEARRKMGNKTSTIKRWARWRDLEIKSPKIEKVQMLFVPGVAGIKFNMKTSLLGDGYRNITVPLSKLGDLVLPQLGDVYCVPHNGGWKIEARPPGREPLILWEEEPFEVEARHIKGGRVVHE